MEYITYKNKVIYFTSRGYESDDRHYTIRWICENIDHAFHETENVNFYNNDPDYKILEYYNENFLCDIFTSS